MSQIAAINRSQRLALLDDDSTVPITTLFDAEGDETNDMAEATAFVAGRDRLWFSHAFADFEERAHGPC